MIAPRLHTFLRAIFLAIIGILLAACTGSNPENPTPDPGPGPGPDPVPDPDPTEVTIRHYQNNGEEESVEMGVNTIYVRSDISSTLKGYDPENHVISFNGSETLDKLKIKVGDYLYSNEQTEMFPDGYCFRVTSVTTKTKADDYPVCEYGVEDATILDAIDYYDAHIKAEWDYINPNNISVYKVIDMPDLETAAELVLDDDIFEKKPLGAGLSVTPGLRNTKLEYVIWEDEGKSQPGYGEVKYAEMKLVVEATVDHDLYNGITFKLDHGKIVLDSDIECGVTLTLKFKIDGKNFNQEEMSKEDRKAFLKHFEQTGSRALGRKVQICSIDLPIGPATVLLRPKVDLLWDFRIEEIAGEFSFTVGYAGARYNFHLENARPWSAELKGKILTCTQEPEWVRKFEGELEGTLATGPALGITVEIPGLRYSGEYKNVRKWKNYKGRTIPAFVGAYLELLLEGSFKLKTSYDVGTSKLFTSITLSSKLKLDVFEEHLLGFGKLIVGYDQNRANLHTWNLGDATYVLMENNAEEYCISPEVGAFLPEGGSVLLEWGTTRENSASLVYDVYLGQDEKNLSPISQSQVDTWYRLTESQIPKPGKYYWKIVSRTPSGQQYESDLWFFTIGDDPGVENHMLPIDLGLPSGISWGDRNLSAENNSSSGLYYQWGSITDVSGPVYWNNYRWSDGTESVMTKYNLTDYITTLEPSDDAATFNNERAGWRMPTKEEWQELKDRCSWTLGQRNGVSGYIVKNEETGAYIFLPLLTDYYGRNGKAASQGSLYWTASRNLMNNISLANAVEVSSPNKVTGKAEPRYEGLMIRPVFDGNPAPVLTVDHDMLDFQGIAVGVSKPAHLAITNTGYSVLYFQVAAIQAPFSCNDMENISLEPGHTRVLEISFAPEEIKHYETDLIFSSNGVARTTVVKLKGNGLTDSEGGIDDVPGQNL